MATEVRGTCRKTSCTWSKDGRCLEGFTETVERCPNFEPLQEVIAEQEPIGEDATAAVDETILNAGDIELPLGTDLDPIDARSVTYDAITRVIVLAGPVGSGKTTLLVSLYHQFQQGPFSGYLFGGSETLLGFERRCYLSREVSGEETEHTERTGAPEGQKFLHLRVRSHRGQVAPRNLLFTDISGELFEFAANSITGCEKLPVIRRADHFALLIDGERLSKREERHGAAIQGRSLLRSCCDSKMLGKFSLVDILVSKWDIVQLSDNRSETEEYVGNLESEFIDFFTESFGRLRFRRIAARPRPESDLTPLYNVDDIFTSWVEDELMLSTVRKPRRLPSLVRECDRYLLKRGQELIDQLFG